MKKFSWKTTLIGVGIALLTGAKYAGFIPDNVFDLILGLATGLGLHQAKDAFTSNSTPDEPTNLN